MRSWKLRRAVYRCYCAVASVVSFLPKAIPSLPEPVFFLPRAVFLLPEAVSFLIKTIPGLLGELCLYKLMPDGDGGDGCPAAEVFAGVAALL